MSLTELQKDKLRQFNSDEVLVAAIRTAFDEIIENEKPRDLGDVSNELIGQKYRGYMEAKGLVNKAFLEIQTYQDNSRKLFNFNKGK